MFVQLCAECGPERGKDALVGIRQTLLRKAVPYGFCENKLLRAFSHLYPKLIVPLVMGSTRES